MLTHWTQFHNLTFQPKRGGDGDYANTIHNNNDYYTADHDHYCCYDGYIPLEPIDHSCSQLKHSLLIH